jgi:2-dehydro-3-deoxyglucarate aldolase
MNRILHIKRIRKALQNGGYSIGSWMQLPNSSVAEMMGQAGYDWVAVDMEHGLISASQLPDLFRALELGNTLPLARLAQGAAKDCKQALDAGAGGVIVPMIKSAEQLIEIRNECRWPPSGSRGVGFSRANLFGKHFEPYREEAQAPILVAMIENISAVKNIDSIVQVEGLDALLIGPYDLSASMGMVAEFDRVDFSKTIDLIRDAANHACIPCGLHIVTPSAADLRRRLNEGYRFIAYSIDAVFFNNTVVNPLSI